MRSRGTPVTQVEFAPEHDAQERSTLVRDGIAVLALGVAAVCAVVLVLPSEGRVAGPLHDALGELLGQAAFMLPVGLGVAGLLLLVRSVRPTLRVPRSRLVGLVVLALAVLATEDRLAPNGAGLVGAWLGGVLDDWLGGAAALLVLLGALVLGALSTFHVGVADVVRGAAALRRRERPPEAPVNVSPWVFAVPRWRKLTVAPPQPRRESEEGRAAS